MPNAYCLIPNAFLLIFLLAAAAPAAETPAPAVGSLKVFVSILPEAWFVERIGGPHVSVEVLVGPGQSPHTFEPTPRQMVSLGMAPLYFSIGWPFEERLLEKIKATAPNLRVVDLRKGIKMRMMTADEQAADEDSHLAPGEHTRPDQSHLAPGEYTGGGTANEPKGINASPHPSPLPAKARGEGEQAPPGEPDPHIWLSPANARIIAGTIADALIAGRPRPRRGVPEEPEALQADIDQVDAQLTKTLAP